MRKNWDYLEHSPEKCPEELRLAVTWTLIKATSYYCYNPLIVLVGRVFANSLKDLGSIPGQVIPKTQKIVLDAALVNTQHYKIQI